MAGGDASADVFAAVMLASSPLFTFFGARLFKPVIGLMGFLFSAIGLQLLLERASVWDGMAPASAMTTVFLAGLAGTILVLSLYSFGVFVLGGTVFILLTNLMFQLTATKFGSGGERGEITRLALSAAVFVAAGVLTLQVWKHVLRILTAFVGGYLFVAGLDHLGVRWNAWSDDSLCAIDALFRSPYTFRCNSPECFTFLGVWGGLFLIGVLYQNRHKDSGRKRTA